MRRITPATVLIVLIFGTASVLAWEAYQSAQSHRQSAERVLNDYVQFAGWEFVRLAQSGLDGSMSQWSEPVCRDGVLMTPEQFNTQPSCKCKDLHALTVFRQAYGRDIEITGEPLTAGTGEWLRALAAAPHGTQQHRSRALRLETVAGVPRVVMATARYSQGGPATTLEGFVMGAAPITRLLQDIVTRHPLLPVTLAGVRNELLVVKVRTHDGTQLYSSGDTVADARLEGRLDDGFGGLAYEVLLKPEAASRLVIGGLPRSRLPVLLGLLALSGALAIAALLQLRREHQLASLQSDFVSSVSHELRTPLAQIRLFSETLLLNRIRSNEEGRRALEIIQQESRRLTHLVENVLFFSRSERGVERVSPRPLPLAPLAAELVEAFLPLARSGRSEVRVEARDGVDALVDPAAFRQILLNLLDNAVKYHGRPDQTIVVAIERRGDTAALIVSDQGPGVPPEARTRIFAPYSRLVTASSSAVAGTGIGLSVVRELVRLHGGTIRVEDAPGGGASFVVEFKGARHASRPRVDTRSQESAGMTATVLIVEDNTDLAYGLRNNLEIEGYAVDVATDGAAGLARARAGAPNLLILDLMLPGLDGYRVLKALREDGDEVPVLILTAHGEEADKVRGFRLGADDYVTKPFGLLELMARVAALLRRTARVPGSVQRERFGDVQVDERTRNVTRHGEAVALTPMEFDLLLALLRREGGVVSRLDLLHEVWGHSAAVLTRTVDTHVAELRRKLEDNPATPRHILTVRKAGYRLDRAGVHAMKGESLCP